MGAVLVLVIAYVALPLAGLTLMLVLVRKTSELSQKLRDLPLPADGSGRSDANTGENDV